MTVSNDNRRARYEGNGAATSFSFDFTLFAKEDLKVLHTAADQTETELTLDVDYTVTGAGDPNGGSVTYPLSGAPLPAGEHLTLTRDLTFTQEVDLQNQGAWLPEVMEGAKV